MTSAWASTLFYQLYSVLYIVGYSTEECFTTLQQILQILVIMQSKGAFCSLVSRTEQPDEFKK